APNDFASSGLLLWPRRWSLLGWRPGRDRTHAKELLFARHRHSDSRGSQRAAPALEFRMSPALSKSLIDILLASGVSSRDEAVALAANLNGSSWTADVLNSGKVDEQLFLKAIGDFFSVPVISIDAKSIERATLLVLPSRFVFQHHILPIEIKDNAVVLATYDLFNSTGRQLASQLLDK